MKQLEPGYIREFNILEIAVGERFRTDLGDIDELAENIKMKGLIQPITIDQGGNLLAGGRRLAAARKAELDTVPVVIRSIEGTVDALEVELFENIHRKDMTWVERGKLEKAIHELLVKKNGLSHTYGETAALLGKSRRAVEERIKLAEHIEIIPELAQCKTEDEARKTGKRMIEQVALNARMKDSAINDDIKAFTSVAATNYKIGDALVEMKKLRTNLFDFMEVDPPYAIDLHNKKKSDNTRDYNEIDPTQYAGFIHEAASQAYRILAPDRWAVWWFGPTHFDLVFKTLKKVGFAVDDIPAIWHKADTGHTSNNATVLLGRGYEMFFVCRKGNPTLINRGRSNVFSFAPTPHQTKIHPTERPIPLILEILKTFTLPKSTVCSPFLGSGTTLLAAYAYGTKAMGWDLSDAYKERFLVRAHKQYYEVNQIKRGMANGEDKEGANPGAGG